MISFPAESAHYAGLANCHACLTEKPQKFCSFICSILDQAYHLGYNRLNTLYLIQFYNISSDFSGVLTHCRLGYSKDFSHFILLQTVFLYEFFCHQCLYCWNNRFHGNLTWSYQVSHCLPYLWGKKYIKMTYVIIL